MELAAQFRSDVSVVNQAKGGKSSKSFLSGADPTANPPIDDDGRMEAIQNSAKEGDYLFIQFGHNDRNTSPERYTDPNSTEENSNSYRYNLKQFVLFAQENGMYPVFLTSIHERKFSGGQLQEDGIEDYRKAMIEVGEELGVPVLDIGAKHAALVSEAGEEGSKELFLHFTKEEYPNYPANLPDNTHISQKAAQQICNFIAEEIRASEDPSMVRLAGYLKAQGEDIYGE